MKLMITTKGNFRCLYSDELDLGHFGRLKITRGSHVEPTPDGRWTADLKPVQGPVLGPYKSRREALAAEIEWLETHWLHSAN